MREKVAVVVFAEVDAVDFTDAAFAAELAVRQALYAAQVPADDGRMCVTAQWPHMSVPVWLGRIAELNTARNLLVVLPAAAAFKPREEE
jgi:hypothetical protein